MIKMLTYVLWPSILVSLCAALTFDVTYEKVFTAYNPLLDDHKLPTLTSISLITCSRWCIKNQGCVSFIYDANSLLCAPFNEFAECELGDLVENFYIIKGRIPRKICECNVAHNESFVNVALQKPVSISSNAFGFPNENLVDGILTNFIHTGFQTNAFCIVNLLEIYDISYFFLANRHDCCSERFRNFKIFVSTDQITWTECYYYPGVVGIDCTARAHTPCIGQYVKVQMFANDYLHLRELEVYTHV